MRAGRAGADATSLHASAVAVERAGILITGPPGSGKSALALELIGLGATLIGDDLVPVSLVDGHPFAHAPPRLRGVIEARKVGLLQVPHVARAPVRLVVDMGQDEAERLPQTRVIALLGVDLPLLYRAQVPHFAVALIQLARSGRYA